MSLTKIGDVEQNNLILELNRIAINLRKVHQSIEHLTRAVEKLSKDEGAAESVAQPKKEKYDDWS